jgi:hypothetical protein
MDDDMSTPRTATEPKPGRRRLLKALAGAGGVLATGALLPERWTRPVVESIIVPAHAQATVALARSYASKDFGSGPSGPPPGPTSRGLGERFLNTIIPAASAGEDPGDVNVFSVCLQPAAGTVEIQVNDCFGTVKGNAPLKADGSFSGSVNGWSVSGQLGPDDGTVDLSAGKWGNFSGIPVLADAPCIEPSCPPEEPED